MQANRSNNVYAAPEDDSYSSSSSDDELSVFDLQRPNWREIREKRKKAYQRKHKGKRARLPRYIRMMPLTKRIEYIHAAETTDRFYIPDDYFSADEPIFLPSGNTIFPEHKANIRPDGLDPVDVLFFARDYFRYIDSAPDTRKKLSLPQKAPIDTHEPVPISIFDSEETVQKIFDDIMQFGMQNGTLDGNEERIEEAILNGACVNRTYANYQTPLHIAVLSKNKKILPLIMESGSKRHEYTTYSEWVAQTKSANLGAKNAQGYTPIHLAAYIPDANIMECLLSHKRGLRNIDDVDSYGRTAYKIALAQKNHAVAQVLIDHGANVAK